MWKLAPTAGELVFIAMVIAVAGWAVIESILWLFSHVTIGWNWK